MNIRERAQAAADRRRAELDAARAGQASRPAPQKRVGQSAARGLVMGGFSTIPTYEVAPGSYVIGGPSSQPPAPRAEDRRG